MYRDLPFSFELARDLFSHAALDNPMMVWSVASALS